MVSLTIGLVIAIAATSAYLGASGSSRASDLNARMNEDAQAALKILSQQIRLSAANPLQANRSSVYAHNPVFTTTYIGGGTTSYTTGLPTFNPNTYTLSNFAIRGCDGTFSNVTTATSTTALNCAGTTTTLPDSIAVSYEADGYDTVAAASTGVAADCLGTALPTVTATFPTGTATTGVFAVADNRFYIATPASSTIPSLYCKGASSTAQPLVENVEDMQFQYGSVASTSTQTTASIAGYLSASDANLEATGTSASAAATNWGRVLTVRICIVVRSVDPVGQNLTVGGYYDCQGNLITTQTDYRLRRAYSTTVVLRNRRY